jgi:thiamine biosynthesis lipoprotein
MRHIFTTMGTVVSLDASDAAPLELIERVFAEADARFSLYRDDSELSRVNAGNTALIDASPELRAAYELAADWRVRTGGAFTPTRPDGLLDLNGVVKAVAMADAGAVLDAAGCCDWTLVVGGDMLAAGSAPGGSPWVTGIVDPADRASLLCAVQLRGSRRAMATSGTAERGDHIWKAGMASGYLQVTVVADDIVTADVLATAIVAGGEPVLREACERWAIDVLTVDAAGELTATPGFRAALAVAA